MNMEERLALRVLIKLAFLVPLLVAAQAYRYGSRPLWFAIAAGFAVVLLLSARVALRRGGRTAGVIVWDTAKRGGRRVKDLAEAFIAAVDAVRRRRRVRRVELAAVDAAENEPMLAPDSVRGAADALFRLVQLARDARDRGRLATLIGPELLAEWEQDLDDADGGDRRTRLEVVGDVRVDYVGFTVPERGPARVVVLIEAALHTHTDNHRGQRSGGETRRLCQYWTLALRDGLWIVVTVEPRGEGQHHLAEPIGARQPHETRSPTQPATIQQ